MNFVDFSSFRVNRTTSPKSLEVRSHMHDTATSKKNGRFSASDALAKKASSAFDFYVKSHAWFGGGAILLRGPLRLKHEALGGLRRVAVEGAILLRGPLRLKPSEPPASRFALAGAILLRGPLRLKRSAPRARPPPRDGAILLRGPLRLKLSWFRISVRDHLLVQSYFEAL